MRGRHGGKGLRELLEASRDGEEGLQLAGKVGMRAKDLVGRGSLSSSCRLQIGSDDLVNAFFAVAVFWFGHGGPAPYALRTIVPRHGEGSVGEEKTCFAS